MMQAKRSQEQIKELLDRHYQEFHRTGFIDNDPLLIPHRYSKKEDIEIAGFFAAILAWGNRKTIIQNTDTLLGWMDHDPSGFIRGFEEADLKPFAGFVHRTFNGDDCLFFLHALQSIYLHHGGLEQVFQGRTQGNEVKDAIRHFRNVFFQVPHLPRSEKHLANPDKNATAKRINMYLRWMVRKDPAGIDFGIWENIQPSMLMCPLDVHTGKTSRKLGILNRKQDDWKAVEELTVFLRNLDPSDPVKYDIALFSMGLHGLPRS